LGENTRAGSSSSKLSGIGTSSNEGSPVPSVFGSSVLGSSVFLGSIFFSSGLGCFLYFSRIVSIYYFLESVNAFLASSLKFTD